MAAPPCGVPPTRLRLCTACGSCMPPDMYLAQVIGSVVATRKSDDMQGIPLLLVQPIDERLRPIGAAHVAADSIGAGPGDTVYCVGARDAALAFAPRVIPVDAAVVGLVDDVHVPVQL